MPYALKLILLSLSLISFVNACDPYGIRKALEGRSDNADRIYPFAQSDIDILETSDRAEKLSRSVWQRRRLERSLAMALDLIRKSVSRPEIAQPFPPVRIVLVEGGSPIQVVCGTPSVISISVGALDAFLKAVDSRPLSAETPSDRTFEMARALTFAIAHEAHHGWTNCQDTETDADVLAAMVDAEFYALRPLAGVLGASMGQSIIRGIFRTGCRNFTKPNPIKMSLVGLEKPDSSALLETTLKFSLALHDQEAKAFGESTTDHTELLRRRRQDFLARTGPGYWTTGTAVWSLPNDSLVARLAASDCVPYEAIDFAVEMNEAVQKGCLRIDWPSFPVECETWKTTNLRGACHRKLNDSGLITRCDSPDGALRHACLEALKIYVAAIRDAGWGSQGLIPDAYFDSECRVWPKGISRFSYKLAVTTCEEDLRLLASPSLGMTAVCKAIVPPRLAGSYGVTSFDDRPPTRTCASNVARSTGYEDACTAVAHSR